MNLGPDDLILNDKYRVERLLGKGAFARVYLVRHLELDVDRAVKVLSRDTLGVGSSLFDDYQARFRLEAQLGARIDHPRVIKVYDLEVEKGALYLVMEYAPGGSLADLLTREGQLALEDFLRIALDAATGLGAIHKQLEIVHRDVKPSNILLTDERRAKIGDLGLAQVEGGMSRRSMLGSVTAPHPGTPLYMSPEQEREYGYLQYPSDVYSLGCVMFEMLTGKAYKTQRPGTRVRDVRDDVPDWADDLIRRCTLRDRFERPWDGNEVAVELQREERRLAQESEGERQQSPGQERQERPNAQEQRAQTAMEMALERARADRRRAAEGGQDAGRQPANARKSQPSGKSQRNAGDHARALDLDNAEYYARRGAQHYFREQYAAAIEDWTRAIELDADNGEYYYYRGRAYERTGNHLRAAVDLAKAGEKGFEEGFNLIEF